MFVFIRRKVTPFSYSLQIFEVKTGLADGVGEVTCEFGMEECNKNKHMDVNYIIKQDEQLT